MNSWDFSCRKRNGKVGPPSQRAHLRARLNVVCVVDLVCCTSIKYKNYGQKRSLSSAITLGIKGKIR